MRVQIQEVPMRVCRAYRINIHIFTLWGKVKVTFNRSKMILLSRLWCQLPVERVCVVLERTQHIYIWMGRSLCRSKYVESICSTTGKEDNGKVLAEFWRQNG